MSDRALIGERLLTKDIPAYQAGLDGVSGDIIEERGWQSVEPATGIYYETYLDLSGNILDDLTAYPLLLELQDGLPYYTTKVDGWLNVVDIISQERLDALTVMNYMNDGNVPGMPSTDDDFGQILMCNYRLMSPQVDFTATNLLLPATAGAFGSNEPTAVEKLWCYRIVGLSGATPWAAGDTLQLPATRFIAAMNIQKEPDLEYMMRLKRSYELGQG